MAVTYPNLTLVSESTTVDTTGNGPSQFGVWGTQTLSASGRYVVFSSEASNLIAGDTTTADVFIRDLVEGTTTRVSTGASGAGNGASDLASVSDDGRYVVFRSSAENLVADDNNLFDDIFVKDMQTGTVTRVSVGDDESQSGFGGGVPSISGDGRYVLFTSASDGLVSGDSDANSDVFRRDLQTGATELVSQGETDGVVFSSMSSDGRYVAYHNGTELRLRDMVAGTTQTVVTDADVTSISVSGNGQYVVFTAAAQHAGTDTNSSYDVYRFDRTTSTIEHVSIGAAGAASNNHSLSTSVSDDGRYVAFASEANNLVAGDSDVNADIFIRDMQTGTTTKLDDTAGATNAFISGDGSTVAFEMFDAVPGVTDGNGSFDIQALQLFAGNSAPEITSAATASVSENTSFVIDITATDAEFGRQRPHLPDQRRRRPAVHTGCQLPRDQLHRAARLRRAAR